MLDEWYRREPEGDEVTDCIALLAEEQDRPSSPAAIRAGQALDDQGRLPFEEVDYALEQIGLRARSVFHKSQRWPERDCPAILSAGPGRALILRSTNADGCAIQLPGGEHLIVSHASLAMVTSGEAVAVTPIRFKTGRPNGLGTSARRAIGSGRKCGARGRSFAM